MNSAISASILVVFSISMTARSQVTSDRLKQLDQHLARETERFHLPGVSVAVVEGNQIVHVHAQGDGVNENAAFLIGSCSKTVTALAALLAFDAAGIDLDTPVNAVLERVTIRNQPSPPTLRHLLQHRSGLARVQGFADLPDLADVEAQGLSVDLQFPPGTRYAYSNANYAMLGLLIEKVTGRAYCEYIQDAIFAPAGMTHSFCGSAPAAGTAPEHQYCFGFPLRVEPTRAPASQIPAGFLRCSARDLARLQICLLHDGMLDGKQVFPASFVRQMKTPAGDAEFGYGMGLVNTRVDGLGPIIAHEGATATAYAFHGALTEQNVGIVLLININLFDPFTDHGETIYTNMLRVLTGRTPIPTYPYRIWLRWALIPFLLFTIWQTATLLTRWKRAGWPFTLPGTPRGRIAMAFKLVLPVAIWLVVLGWVGVPFRQVLQLDPDIMGSLLFLTAAGMVTGVIKTGAGHAIRLPPAAPIGEPRPGDATSSK